MEVPMLHTVLLWTCAWSAACIEDAYLSMRLPMPMQTTAQGLGDVASRSKSKGSLQNRTRFFNI